MATTSPSDRAPEPLAALAAIEAEITAIRDDATQIENDWVAFLDGEAQPREWTPTRIFEGKKARARQLVAMEQQLSERRRSLNERLAPAAPQAAPAEPVKAERGKVKRLAFSWTLHEKMRAEHPERAEDVTIEAYAARNGIKLKSLKNAIAALRTARAGHYAASNLGDPHKVEAPPAPMPAPAISFGEEFV